MLPSGVPLGAPGNFCLLDSGGCYFWYLENAPWMYIQFLVFFFMPCSWRVLLFRSDWHIKEEEK